jgi:hypothetical protein
MGLPPTAAVSDVATGGVLFDVDDVLREEGAPPVGPV